MKTIKLKSPEKASELFSKLLWTDTNSYFICAQDEASTAILANAHESQHEAKGSSIRIKVGTEYTIDLEAYQDNLDIEWTDEKDLGALLRVNSEPYLLRVYRQTKVENIQILGELFPQLRIIDFGSGKNENIQNLFALESCANLEVLNLDNCPNLKDISTLPLLKKLNTLWLDGFHEDSQFGYIGMCDRLSLLSQNSSDLSTLQHLAELKNLNGLFISHNQNLSNLEPLSQLTQLRVLNLSSCENISDIRPLTSLAKLEGLNLNSCENITEINTLAALESMESLDLSSCTNLTEILPLAALTNLNELKLNGCRSISDISPLTYLKNLRVLEMIWLENISSLNPLSSLNQLKTLDLSACENIKEIGPLRGLTTLNSLNLDGCKNISDLDPLAALIQLEILDLGSCANLNNIESLASLTQLKQLDLNSCNNLSDIEPLTSLIQLETLNLSSCEILADIRPLASLTQLNTLNLSSINNLSFIEPLTSLIKLETLKMSYCEILIDISPLNALTQLKQLDLNSCNNLSDIEPLTSLIQLETLNLSYCEILSDISPLASLAQLKKLDLAGSKRIFFIKPLETLPSLISLGLSDCANIRDFSVLSTLPNLNELTWIDPVACSEVLIQNACNRRDINYISTNLKSWTSEIELSKNANSFALRLLSALHLTSHSVQQEQLPFLAHKLRMRGLQSSDKNDIESFTWEAWCALVIKLPLEQALYILEAVIVEPDITLETEVLLAPVLLAYSDLADLYSNEKTTLIKCVEGLLKHLDGHHEKQRLIAPSASVFFATIQMRDEVLKWLEKATSEKAPQWRDRVLKALVKHYARKESFNEAKLLINEMTIQDEKDSAIATLSEFMAQKHPVEAGFMLNRIENIHLSSKTAQNMLNQSSMLTQPQAVYQLLLHLQETPDDLAICLEAIIEVNSTGKEADALRNLFLTPSAMGTSAAKLLELCYHEAVGEFVKPRALEKFKSHLIEKSAIENASAIPQFIIALQENELIDAEEAIELSKLMNA